MARSKVFPSESTKCLSLESYLRTIATIRAQWIDPADEIGSRGDMTGVWYRGQADAKWGLTPSRWRKEYTDANESEIRLEFESVGRQLVSPDHTRDKWAWYFLMAHYGAPTRLLDWTVNPLVALYFAVSSALPKTDAAIWIIDPWQWNKAHIPGLFGPALPGWKETEPYLWGLEEALDTDNRDTARKWPIALEPPHIDKRITAQEGRFLLFGNAKDMVTSPKITTKGPRSKRAKLDKIVLAQSKVLSILDELNSVSINEKTIFPDLAGLGKHICWKWKKL